MSDIAAAIVPEPGAPVEIHHYPEPELEPDSALLDVVCSEVCGTDVYLREGRLEGVPYPLIPGHVSVGRIAEKRGRITDVEGREIAEGELVTFLDVHETCHACWYCLVAKASTRCPQRKVYGITYGADDVLAGGWAEKIYLKPRTRVIPLGSVDPDTFMAGGCGLPTALHGVERGDIRLGDRVLVLGSGPVGLAAVILARLRGAGSVLVIGGPETRLTAARAVGADDALDFQSLGEEERIAWVRERTHGRGADVTIEATGAPVAVTQAMHMTRDSGRVVVVGQYTDHGEVAFNPHTDLNKKHLDVRGCWGSDYSHFHRAVELLSVPRIAEPFSRIPVAEFDLATVNEALDQVAAGTVVKALVRPGSVR